MSPLNNQKLNVICTELSADHCPAPSRKYLVSNYHLHGRHDTLKLAKLLAVLH
jgi:hypothetical protein